MQKPKSLGLLANGGGPNAGNKHYLAYSQPAAEKLIALYEQLCQKSKVLHIFCTFLVVTF
jgi:hypothetical protein